jgi:NitT/TauT family transport system substrate-binding protein
MIELRTVFRMIALAGLVALPLASPAARADDLLRVATGGQGAWDASIAELGKNAGIFREYGIDLEINYTDGGGKALEATVAGSADVALGTSVPSLIGAAVKGAPVKMVAGVFVGLSDTIWYVRADSPIKSIKDFTEETTIAYTAAGAYSQMAAMGLIEQSGVAAKPVVGGARAAVMTLVMSGQIDVGFDGNGGMGVAEFQRGDVRIIAVGADVESFRGLTVRGIAVNARFLAERRDLVERFLKAYQRSIDWAYTGTEAMKMYAGLTGLPLDEVERLVPVLYPKSAFGLAEVGGIDRSIEQGLKFKRIAERPTEEQLEAMFETLWLPEQM